jgi:hypothetical protein
MYKLTQTQDKDALFFRLEGESIERHGSVGYLRADFGNSGFDFYFKWFDSQPHLKTNLFRREIDSIINELRVDGQDTPLANRKSLESFYYANPGKELAARGRGYLLRTDDFSYYFRCFPRPGDYDVYMFAYDNRYLLPELAGQHELPEGCFSVLPSTGQLIFVVSRAKGYLQISQSTDETRNRKIADSSNELYGITKAQEEALIAGALFGWDKPAAKPWRYDLDGSPRLLPQKEKEHSSR